MRLQGTNFQSLTEFDLDVSGLTVVVGPSNKGKSAIFRALRGMFRNELSSEYIRTGSNGLELTATLDGGIIIAERTPKGSTQYKINDKPFKKLNQTIPPELRAFGMNEVEVGDFTIDPIFARQNGKQFLIDSEAYTPMELNTILGAFASTEKLEAGKKAANLEITHKNAEAKTLAEEVVQAETRKALMETFDRDAEGVAQGLKRLKPDVEGLEAKKHWLMASMERQRALQPLQEVVSELSVPDMGGVERLVQARDYAVQATNSFRINKFCRRVQDGVGVAATTGMETAKLASTIQLLVGLAGLLAHHQKCDIRPLTAALGSTNEGFTKSNALTESIILLKRCRTYLDHTASLRSQLTDTDQDMNVLKAQIQETQEQMQENQKVTCPACGNRFDPSHTCEVIDARTT
jgi:hypothetical protein